MVNGNVLVWINVSLHLSSVMVLMYTEMLPGVLIVLMAPMKYWKCAAEKESTMKLFAQLQEHLQGVNPGNGNVNLVNVSQPLMFVTELKIIQKCQLWVGELIAPMVLMKLLLIVAQ